MEGAERTVEDGKGAVTTVEDTAAKETTAALEEQKHEEEEAAPTVEDIAAKKIWRGIITGAFAEEQEVAAMEITVVSGEKPDPSSAKKQEEQEVEEKKPAKGLEEFQNEGTGAAESEFLTRAPAIIQKFEMTPT